MSTMNSIQMAIPEDEDSYLTSKVQSMTEAEETKGMSDQKIYLIALAFRMTVGVFLSIHTYYKPDQYFQGPEVAHHMVFGTGELSWEWTFKDPIRNPLFPAFYAFGYLLLKILRLDTFLPLFSIFPQIQQAFVAAFFDLMLVKINRHYNGVASDYVLLTIDWGGWVTLSYVSRTFVNPMQATLTMSAFYFWLKRKQNPRFDIYCRILVSFNFAMRATSIMFWTMVWPYQLIKQHSKSLLEFRNFVLKNLITIAFMISVSVLVSLLYYKRLTWVDYNFFYYNVVLGWSTVAGDRGVYNYFMIGHPKTFNVLIILLLWSIYKVMVVKPKENEESNLKFKELFWFVLLGLILLSFNSHKELRLMLVYVPYEIILIVKGYNTFFPKKTWIRKALLVLFIGISAYRSIMMNFIFKSGPMAMSRIMRDQTQIKKIYLLQSSYSVPMYSYVHRADIEMINVGNPYNEAFQGRSERDDFMQQPDAFLQKVLQKHKNLTHIMMAGGGATQADMNRVPFKQVYEYETSFMPIDSQVFRIYANTEL